jgi:biotin transport system substrate-specific component
MIDTIFASSAELNARQSLIRTGVLAVVGSALLAISAKVQVPFWPVPMTMQTLVVLLIGAHGGVRLAAATVLAYLLEGAAGLPVFSTGAGLAFMAGPTGGYLAGFLVAALVSAYAVEKGFAKTLIGAAAVFIVADTLILALGFAWLSTLIGAEKAIAVGVIPFLPAEALKIALATASMPLVHAFLQRSNHAE